MWFPRRLRSNIEMRPRIPAALLLPYLLALALLFAGAARLAADDAADGAALAAELCNLRPAENTDFRGTLTVHRRGTNDVSFAFSSRSVLTETNWSESYAARRPQGHRRVPNARCRRR